MLPRRSTPTEVIKPMTEQVILAFSSCGTVAEADRIAGTLIEEGIAACVNQLPGVTSTYRWQGKVEHQSEVLLMIKTVRSNFEQLRARLQTLHSYELPELIAIPLIAGNEPYLDWVRENSKITALGPSIVK
jgi:periplasmic divalent cation tolerance protein